MSDHYSSPENMSGFEFSIRCMQEEDVVAAVDTWCDTGMGISLSTVRSWRRVDPEGFILAVLNSGEIIGVCGAVINEEDIGMVGMYGVKRKYRRKGVGFAVWNAIMSHIGERNACLNGVLEMQEKYQLRGGFPVYETDWMCLAYVSESPVNPEALAEFLPDGVTVHVFEDSHLPLIFEFDQKLMGYKRHLALELNCKDKDGQTFVAIKDNTCVGFGSIKLYGKDSVIVGPLYADTATIAEVILRNLILSFSEGKGFITVTFSDNLSASDLMERIGCKLKEKYCRLYKKEKRDIDHSKLFAMFDVSFAPH